MIHPTAIIDPGAQIAENVSIGPWSIIGPQVTIGEGTVIASHVVIKGPTSLGCDNQIYQFCSIGDNPQDKKYDGNTTRLEIGDRNIIRESCTINRGTTHGGKLTRIGDDNLLMAYSHVAHDCFVGNSVVFANNASLAGHVIVEDFVILSAFSGVHQFCRMGSHSFAAASSIITKDVPPFVKVSGYYAEPFGLNLTGLKRRGFSQQTLINLRRAYKLIYRQGLTLNEATEQLAQSASECPEVKRFLIFIQESERGIVR